jgi:hypothetical protein
MSNVSTIKRRKHKQTQSVKGEIIPSSQMISDATLTLSSFLEFLQTKLMRTCERKDTNYIGKYDDNGFVQTRIKQIQKRKNSAAIKTIC